MERAHVMKDYKRVKWGLRITSGELKCQISLSLQNKIKTKTKQNAKNNNLFSVFKLCVRLYHHPHIPKTITKISKKDKQRNDNIKTRKVYS